jgi:hypothetical protein
MKDARGFLRGSDVYAYNTSKASDNHIRKIHNRWMVGLEFSN